MLNQELPNEEGSEQQRCAICFLQKPLFFAPCTHNACQDCFERILLATNPSNYIDIDIFNNNNNDASNIEALEDSIIASCPTRGRCPFCRTYLSMFDLKYRTNSSTLDYNDMSNKNDANLVSEQKDDEKGHDHNNPIIANDATDAHRFAYRHLLNLKETPLNSLTFTDDGRRSSNINKSISFKDGVAEISIYESSTNGKKELIRSQQFDNKYHYHEKSMTFSGIVDWMKGSGPLEGVAKWEVILQFSSDLRYIRRGAIIKTRYEKNKNDDDDDNDIDDSIKRRYPLDGTWKLQYLKRQQDLDVVDDMIPTSNIIVVGNKFMHQTTLYNICIPRETGNVNDDNSNSSGTQHKVHFDWPTQNGDNRPYRQVVESGIDLRENPHGPDVGSVVIWTVDHPDFHRISWKLESKGIPPIQVEHLAGRGIMFYAERDNSISQTDKITFNSSSPWGNAFIQMQTLGLASYHFVPHTENEEEFAYISYEHERCSSWPSLDNGELVPYRVPFVNHSYDSETRTFRGEIRWMGVYGTTWQGCDTWIYEIVFDSKFTCIVKGGVKMSHTNRFETISSYGEDLIYCNVALVEIIKAEVNADLSASHAPLDENRNENNVEHSTTVNGNDDDHMENNTPDSSHTNDTVTANYNEFNQPVQLCTASLKTRLRNEGTSERTLVMISQISHGAINPMLNPIDYNGVQRE